MSSFEWHMMAESEPNVGKGRYVVLGNGGGLYVSNEYRRSPRGGASFYIPNRRSNFMDASSVKAWAEVPPCEQT